MSTIVRGELLAILKGAEALARELTPRYPWLFAEQPQQPTTEEATNDSIVVFPPTDHHQRPAALVREGG